MKVVAYCRVSTEGQVKEGVSLEMQEKRIIQWADNSGHRCVATYRDEGISGAKTSNRPELEFAIERAIHLKGIFCVYSLSRATRSVIDAYELLNRLEKGGASFCSVTENIDTTTAIGRAMVGLLTILSQFEREQIGERTKAALQHKKSKGERVGSIPYGYELSPDGVMLVNNPSEQEICKIIRGWRVTCRWPLRTIQDELNKAGHLSRNGGLFRLETIADIARREE